MFDEILRRRTQEVIEEYKKLIDQAMENTFEASQRDVPVRTGKLKASAKRTDTQIGDTFVYEITYGGTDKVDYAVLIHEDSSRPYFKFLQRAFIAEVNKMGK